MSANVETMMYSGQVPWHGLGVYVGDQDVDSKTAIVQAGLDWDVTKQRLFTSDDGINVAEIEDHKAIVRSSDKSVLGIVGQRYFPIQNKEAFEFMDGLAAEGKVKYHTAGSLRNGQVIWLLAKVGDCEILPKDKVDQYLFLYNTHDGSSSLRVLFTCIRVVCANTAKAALSEGVGEGLRVLHTRSLKDRLKQANEILGIAQKKFDDYTAFAKQMTKVKINDTMWDDFSKKMFPDPTNQDASKKIITMRENTRKRLTTLFHDGTGQDIPGVAGTGWAAYGAVVEYANYIRAARGENKQNNRFESSLFGGSSHLIDKAVNELKKIAA